MLRPDGRASGRKSFVLLVMGMVIFFLCSLSSADVPHMINYQGKLTTASGGCLNDIVQMTFSIYPDTLGSPADWSETQTEVVVKEGIFNVLLGAVDTIPQAVFDGNVKYLGVQVESDDEMRPLKPMVSVAYAYRAGTADGGGDCGWVDDGNVVRLETETDSVGIGTATPTEKLDVDGNVKASGTITSGSSITIDGANDKITATGGTIDFDDENIVTTGKATIGPGHTNTGTNAFVAGENNEASGNYTTVGGGASNQVAGNYSTIGGGQNNSTGGYYNAIAGGSHNRTAGLYSSIAGGAQNRTAGDYSFTVGYADTIFADYSYLFGIDSDLSQDSTFMVDMPHVRIGDEATGYELPTEDGTADQVMATDGAGQVSWVDASGGGGGGSTFIRWGNSFAPTGVYLIYSGYGYGSHYSQNASNSPVVIASGDPGASNTGNSGLYPLGTGSPPPGITTSSYVLGAVCYLDKPTVIMWGTHTPPAGWTVLYRGYAMSAHNSFEGPGGCPICVDCENFQNDPIGTPSLAMLYGVQTDHSPEGGHQDNCHIKCVVLKKQ